MTSTEIAEARKAIVSLPIASVQVVERDADGKQVKANYKLANAPFPAAPTTPASAHLAAIETTMGCVQAAKILITGLKLVCKAKFAAKSDKPLSESTVNKLFGEYVAANTTTYVARIQAGETPDGIKAEIRAAHARGIVLASPQDCTKQEAESAEQAVDALVDRWLTEMGRIDAERLATTG
jgi:hypothetical protein